MMDLEAVMDIDKISLGKEESCRFGFEYDHSQRIQHVLCYIHCECCHI